MGDLFPLSEAERKLILRLRSLKTGVYLFALWKLDECLKLSFLGQGKEEHLGDTQPNRT